MSIGFDVVVVGSVNVDMVVHASTLPSPGSTVTGGVYERYGGGKGANQAVAAARLGARVALIAAVGDDDAGRETIEELGREGVDVSRVVHIDDVATGVALIVVDRKGENQIAVASGANEHLDGAMVEAAVSEVTLRDGGVCLIGFEVGDPAIEAAATWASSHGRVVILDPAPARTLSPVLTASKPIATPNEGELLDLTGETEVAVAATSLSHLTRNSVVVTLGSEGVLLHDHGALTNVPPYKMAAVDSTGAGDAFTGALAVGLAEGSSIAEAVDLAQATAALSVCSEGARSGMPSREDVEEMIDK
jgi:ribokinase